MKDSERLSLFVQVPFHASLNDWFASMKKSELYAVHAFKFDSALFPVLLQMKPCLILISTLDESSKKEGLRFLHDFRQYRRAQGYPVRDPALRIVVIAKDRQAAGTNWPDLGVYELMIAPVPPNVLTYKISRHHQKALAADRQPRPQVPPEVAPMVEVTHTEAAIQREWRVFQASEPPSKPELRAIIEIEATLPSMDPEQGEWVPQAETEAENRWEWKPHSQHSGTPRLSFSGEKPVYEAARNAWKFSGEAPRLTRTSEDVTKCAARDVAKDAASESETSRTTDVLFQTQKTPDRRTSEVQVKPQLQIHGIRRTTYSAELNEGEDGDNADSEINEAPSHLPPSERSRSNAVQSTAARSMDGRSVDARSTEAQSAVSQATDAQSTDARPMAKQSATTPSTIPQSAVSQSTTAQSKSTPLKTPLPHHGLDRARTESDPQNSTRSPSSQSSTPSPARGRDETFAKTSDKIPGPNRGLTQGADQAPNQPHKNPVLAVEERAEKGGNKIAHKSTHELTHESLEEPIKEPVEKLTGKLSNKLPNKLPNKLSEELIDPSLDESGDSAPAAVATHAAIGSKASLENPDPMTASGKISSSGQRHLRAVRVEGEPTTPNDPVRIEADAEESVWSLLYDDDENGGRATAQKTKPTRDLHGWELKLIRKKGMSKASPNQAFRGVTPNAQAMLHVPKQTLLDRLLRLIRELFGIGA